MFMHIFEILSYPQLPATMKSKYNISKSFISKCVNELASVFGLSL